MKKILSIVLVIAMVMCGSIIGFAASSFTDITDESTANAVEVLRLMGVVEGVGDGTYNPSGTLTRSEFAKLAVVSTHSDADLSKYKNMTIFPDVKASEWFASYINMASQNLKIIFGCTDGLFHPERTISVGEAVTILLRLIGFSDEEVGGVWPYGQYQKALDLGMLAGTSISSATGTMTRADAAKLFVNTISVDAHWNQKVFKLSNETVLISVDQGSKTLKTKDRLDNPYRMLKAISGNTLVGKAGYVVRDANNSDVALSFIPKSVLGYDYPQAVVLKSSDVNTLNALAGRKDYTIYKNGAKVTADKIKSGDVAIYVASENKIVVCDTTIRVYYDSCEGSLAEPVSIKAGNIAQSFTVLPLAVKTISNYKPGMSITLSLTSDGKIAAASSSSNGNGVFVVSYDGTANLICGNNVLDLGIRVDDTKLYGKAIKVSYATKDKLNFTAVTSSEGTLKVAEKKLGSKKIADNVLIFNNGEIATLADIVSSTISYARTNANGEVDLIVAADSAGGKQVVLRGTRNVEYDDEGNLTEDSMHFEGPEGISMGRFAYSDDSTGFYTAYYNGTNLNSVIRLNYMGVVKKEDFENNSLVYVNGSAKSIKADVACYNTDLGANHPEDAWTTLEEAFAYGREFTCYGRDGVVYLVSYTY